MAAYYFNIFACLFGTITRLYELLTYGGGLAYLATSLVVSTKLINAGPG